MLSILVISPIWSLINGNLFSTATRVQIRVVDLDSYPFIKLKALFGNLQLDSTQSLERLWLDLEATPDTRSILDGSLDKFWYINTSAADILALYAIYNIIISGLRYNLCWNLLISGSCTVTSSCNLGGEEIPGQKLSLIKTDPSLTTQWL